jgi:hypothetical protein
VRYSVRRARLWALHYDGHRTKRPKTEAAPYNGAATQWQTAAVFILPDAPPKEKPAKTAAEPKAEKAAKPKAEARPAAKKPAAKKPAAKKKED